MAPDFVQAMQGARAGLLSVIHPDPLQHGPAWHVYQTTQLAAATFKRTATVAYTLGIAAGIEFGERSDMVPGAPFRSGTIEAADFTDGIKHALAVMLLVEKLHDRLVGGA